MSAKKENREVEPSEEREYHSPSSGIFFKIKRLLCRDKSDYQKIEVIENEYFGKVLLLDGLVQTTERDEFFYHEMLVHPAFVAHPSPQSILIIGGGDGGALKEILRYPIKYACLVEIDQQVVDISKEYFPWLQASLEDERTELVIADGVEFIEKTDKKFDIVFIDSSDPTGPSASFHERDFYEKLKRSLNLEGIVVSQEGSPFYHLDSIKKKNAFFKKLFKTACFYMSPVPTYPGGSWCFAFLSDEIKPLNTKRNPPQELKYFNHDVYQAAFSLPTFLKDLGSSA